MSIQNLSLQNFQSHKDSFIKFAPGVSVITGDNDSGKTAILRAINWVVNNRPSGEEFRSNWGGDTSVAINIGNKIVTRIRSDKDNIYTLSGEKEPFKAFGQSVPELIKQHLNINTVNISRQLEGPFLLGMSDADVAKHYNNAVNLDVIDRAISNIASTLRKEKSFLKTETERELVLKNKLKEYTWLPDAEIQIIKLENLQQNITQDKNDWSILQKQTHAWKELEGVSLSFQIVIKFESDVLSLIAKRNKTDKLLEDYKELYLLIEKLNALNKSSAKLEQIIQYKDKVNTFIQQANWIEKAIENKNTLKNYIKQLSNFKEAEKQYKEVIKYTGTTQVLLVLNEDIDKSISEYNLLQELINKEVLLNQKYKDLGLKLKKLQSDFKRALPKICPIFDIPCERMESK